MSDSSGADRLETYTYELPEELIARFPPQQREDARLMVVDRRNDSLSHRSVRDLPDLLATGDCLVLNDTRVVPARLIGRRSSTGGRWEGLFLRRLDNGDWKLIGQTRGRLRPGESVTLESVHHAGDVPPLNIVLQSRDDEGVWTAQPDSSDDTFELLHRYGTVPLPPYMQRDVADPADRDRYQTVYAEHPGSVAAPTAGLHFTPELLQRCADRGISTARVTLHVGIGTFRPISVSDLADHQMHSEWCEVSGDTASTLNRVRQLGGRIVCVGTTSVRTLESAASNRTIHAWRGDTRLFIRPPYTFNAVDCLLTNFHLPRSTLLVLVSALAGTDRILHAYQTAVSQQYRFFSYGDAMLIL